MAKNTSVTIGAYYENFISEQIARGSFGSASEAIRAGLRLLEERQRKVDLLRQALIEGENSRSSEFSLEELIAELDADAAKRHG